ncbi:DNA (cytosine-5-)-methyltransferase [Campylobacter sp. MIT 99-7217]|uniref:DNA (cytosine-5-)-methyltransferase n=1 Tax=Campylobacter sp. MIT 99-7217 TaxID=535091 RepID=UPI0011571324|nr:DNA (cytosine-5-)-methyltransferase [Campylobacter sp. MIT 99-7217]TQR34611.1 DNA (cytosine-5-)-methyltransferase [Campylobacter sp. MIT 99-7217]
MSLSFIDFCSGIGGGRLALSLNGFNCLGFSEIDKAAIKSYESFFDTKDELKFGDLTKIRAKHLPDFDLLISGFPCQSFSIVGKREGFENEEKGQIIFYLAEILRQKKPKFLILENVKGLINHNKGQSLRAILELLQNCGYSVAYKLLNSLDFGLAQSRERVYFVGIRKDLNKKFSFENTNFLAKKSSDLRHFLSPNTENIFDQNSLNYQTFLSYLNNKYNKNKFKLKELLQRDFLVLDTRQSDLRLYEGKIPTLRRDRQGLFYVFDKELYKLSAIEALKLQGFDKIENLTQKIKTLKTSDILRQCGNAMSVNVVEDIARNLKRTFYG